MRNEIKNAIDHKYEKDLQIVRLVGDPVGPGETQRYVLSLPYDFIAIKAVCVVNKINTAPETAGLSVVSDPPLLVKSNFAGTDVDKEFAPLRALWGTAKFPFIYPNPYPLNNGELISIEVQNKGLAGTDSYIPTFSIIGYRPTRAQMRFVVKETNQRYIRPLQTTVAKAASGSGALAGAAYPATTEPSIFSTTLGFDFELTKFTGSVFKYDNATGRLYEGDAEPTIWQRLEAKSFIYDNVEEPFRNVFGTGENPQIVSPHVVLRNADTINVYAREYTRLGADADPRVPYFVFVGAVPNPVPAFVDENGVPFSYMDKLEKARGQYRGNRERVISAGDVMRSGGNVVRR